MSLIEMMISLGIGVVAASVFAVLIQIQAIYSLRATDQSQFNELMNNVHTILSDGILCSSFFGGLPLPTPTPVGGVGPGPSLGYAFTKRPLGTNLQPLVEKPFPNQNYGRLNVDQIRIQNIAYPNCTSPGPSPSTTRGPVAGTNFYCAGRGSFDLFIEGNSLTGSAGIPGVVYSSVAQVYFTVDPDPHPTATPGVNYIFTCISGAYGVNVDATPPPPPLNKLPVFPDQICTEMGFSWNGPPALGKKNCSTLP